MTSTKRHKTAAWTCHLKPNDKVAFRKENKWFLGTVLHRRLMKFTNFQRIGVSIRGTYVSHSCGVTTFVNDPNRFCYEVSFPLTNGGTVHDPTKAIVCPPVLLDWRQSIKKCQEVWFRSGYQSRSRTLCVVMNVDRETLTLQPKFSKLKTVVRRESVCVQPVLLVRDGAVNFSFCWHYAFQTPISLDWRTDDLLGCRCTLAERPGVEGTIIQVDHGAAEPLYCFYEPMTSELRHVYHFEMFNSIQWVRRQDIGEIIFHSNALRNREEVRLGDTVEATIETTFYPDDASRRERLLSLVEEDRELAFYYILLQSKGTTRNRVLFAIGYLLWSHATYKVRSSYRATRDRDLACFLEMMVQKQLYYDHWNPEEAAKAGSRMNGVFDGTLRDTLRHSLELEESFWNVPIFTFRPIEITPDGDRVRLKIGIKYNGLYTSDVVCYHTSVPTINAVAIRPIMESMFPTPRCEPLAQVFKLSTYSKERTVAFRNDLEARGEAMILKKRVIPSLKTYQSWMVEQLQREEASTDFMTEIFCRNFSSVQYNELCGFTPELSIRANGGLLHLNTGWGKTVIMIELMLRSPCSTLVVAPLTLIDQWKYELKTFAPGLKVSEYYGRRKSELGDVVLTTYGTLRQFHTVSVMKAYDRVVFDESHVVKNQTSQIARACYNVRAKARWCVTATPYNENLVHFQSQLYLLKMQPFHKPFRILDHDQRMVRMLKRVLFGFHKKSFATMGIVPIQKAVVPNRAVAVAPDPEVLQLLTHVAELVDCASMVALKAQALKVQVACTAPMAFPLASYSKRNEGRDQEITKDQLIENIRANTTGSADYRDSVIQTLQESNDGTCCICLDEYTEATITPCLHIFCNRCIKTSLHHKKQCPACRQPVTEQQLKKMVLSHVSDAVEGDEYQFTDVLGNHYTVPVAVRKVYDSLKAKTPKKFLWLKEYLKTAGSCVVFSQFAVTLQRLEKYLKREGVETALISGKTTRKQRRDQIDRFMKGDIRTFLLSTKTASVGINLQKGSSIVFLEPVLSHDDRVQSIGRLHRIGQMSDIEVLTLCTTGTYEETMLPYLKTMRKESRRAVKMVGRGGRVKQAQIKRSMYKKILNL